MPRDKSVKKGSQAKAPAPHPAQAQKRYQGKASAKPAQSKISDELRQAVKDLGGDDEDLELIAGVDEDEADSDAGPAKAPGKGMSEKDLRKELGSFMKGLDFKSLIPSSGPNVANGGQNLDSEEEEEEDEEDDEEDEDEEDEEDEDDDEDEDEDNDKESEEEEAPARKEPVQAAPKAMKTTAAPAVSQDPNSTSGSVVPAAPVWTTLLPDLPSLPNPLPALPQAKLANLRSRGAMLLENLPALSRASSSSDAAFISQVLQSGTHQDKLAALILLVRESPIHAVKELSRLRSMTGWKEDGSTGGGGNKDQRVAVIKALADWWVSGGGKEKGKLRYFADQPLLAHPQITDRHLLVFAFEEFLKKWFFSLLQVLEVLSHDTLPFVRTQALHIVFRLLSGNAEQEQNLLRLGVNKIGDSDRAVASKASHHILQLLQVHPVMKAVVAREVSSLVLKPAGSSSASQDASSSHVRFGDDKNDTKKAEAKSDATSHARYYGLITLNQITLSNKDNEVASRLVELYFEVFREVLGEGLKQKEEGAGAGEDGEGLDETKIEKVAGKVEKWRGRRKGAKPKGGRKSALETEELVETGEAKLVAAVLTGINRALPYAKLDDAVFTSYMDTLFKITHAGTFNTSIQALQLIFQVSQARQVVSDRFYRTLYDSLFDGRLVTSSKQAMYLNLLFKALKADASLPRVMAFVKRLLQMLGLHQPPFICGALYLLGELFNTTPGLKRMLIEPEDNDEEHFVDVPEEGAPTASKADVQAESSKAAQTAYDGKKREPLYSHADSSCLWDLLPFLDHFHPSVSLQASQLLLSQPLTGSPDISLNSLVSFLDRFVYRNPKKTLQPKGASIMQPAAASDKSGMVVSNKGARTGEEGFVNSEKFWRKKIEEVPVDQLFFHKYFSTKLAQKSAAKKKGKAVSDDEDEGEDEDEEMASEVEEAAESEDEGEKDGSAEDESELDEDEVWKAMQASMPDAEDGMGLSDESDEEVYDEDEDEDEEVDEAESVDDEDGDEDEDEEDLDIDDEDVDIDDEVDLSEDEDLESASASASASESESSEPAPAAETKSSKSKAKTKPRARSPSPGSDSDFPDLGDEDEDLIALEEMDDIVLRPEISDEEEQDEPVQGVQGKRKRGEDRKERKKKRREMPTFGSYEEYAKLIEEAGNDGED